jgi:hypothetical protein
MGQRGFEYSNITAARKIHTAMRRSLNCSQKQVTISLVQIIEVYCIMEHYHRRWDTAMIDDFCKEKIKPFTTGKNNCVLNFEPKQHAFSLLYSFVVFLVYYNSNNVSTSNCAVH